MRYTGWSAGAEPYRDRQIQVFRFWGKSMAKKTAAARQANASRRLAAAAKGQGITLVKAPGAASSTPQTSGSASHTLAGATGRGSQEQAASTATNKPANRIVSKSPAPGATTVTRPRPAAARPAASSASTTAPGTVRASTTTTATPPSRPVPTPAASSSAAAAAPRQAPPPVARVARTSRTARARGSVMVTPEHYAYVKSDLRLIGALAFIMFLVIIALYFYLHSIGQA